MAERSRQRNNIFYWAICCRCRILSMFCIEYFWNSSFKSGTCSIRGTWTFSISSITNYNRWRRRFIISWLWTTLWHSKANCLLAISRYKSNFGYWNHTSSTCFSGSRGKIAFFNYLSTWWPLKSYLRMCSNFTRYERGISCRRSCTNKC